LGSSSLYWRKLYAKYASTTAIDASGYVSTTNLYINGSSITGLYHKQGGNAFNTTSTIGTTDAKNVTFVTGGTSKMTILSGGNVGIGTTYPTKALEVNDTTSDPVNSVALRIIGTDSVGTTQGSYGLSRGIDFYNTADTIARSGIYSYFNRFNDNNSALGFWTSQHGGTYAERLRIAGNGNIGIGTTNPYLFKLTVAGTIAPSTTNSYDLGGSSNYWRKLYANYASTTGVDALGYVSTTRLYANTGLFVNSVSGTDVYGAIRNTTNKSADVSGTYYDWGIESRTNFNQRAGTLDSGYTIGMFSAVDRRDTASDLGTINEIDGFYAEIGHLGAVARTTNNFYGVHVSPFAQGGTIGNLYGYYMGTVSGAGTVNNKYGVYISDTSAKNYFGGNVGIGTSNPYLYKLTVAGTIAPSTTNSYDLGAASYYWRKLYATNVSSTAIDATGYVSTTNLWVNGHQVISANPNLQQVTDQGYVTTNPIRVNGVSSTASILPTTNGAYDLGSASYYWRKLYGKYASTTALDALGYVSTTKLITGLGTNSLPSLTFQGDADTGIYSVGDGQVAISSNGTQRLKVSGTVVTVTANILSDSNNTRDIGSSTDYWKRLYATNVSSTVIDAMGYVSSTRVFAGDGAQATPSFTFRGDPDTGLYRLDSGRIMVSSNGSNAFLFGSSYNYSYAGLLPGSHNAVDLGSGNGQNAWRNLYVSSTSYLTDVIAGGTNRPRVTNSYDLGAASYYWRKLYAKYASTTGIDALGYVSTTDLNVAGTYANDIIKLPGIAKNPTGFTSHTDNQFLWNDGTRTFSIGPKSPATSYTYYISGLKYTKSATSTVTIPNTEGVWYFYFNGSTLTASQTEPAYNDYPMISNGYWSVAMQKLIGLAEERHGISMDPATHDYLHHTIGTRYSSGLTLTGTTGGTGNSNGDAQVALSNGVIFDEDLEHDITNAAVPVNLFEQVLSPTSSIPVYFRKGSSADNWEKKNATYYPVYDNSGTRISYNQLVGNTWSTTTIPNTDFVAMWIFATNDVREPVIAVLGQREDGTLANAQANNTYATLAFGNLPFQEMKILYRLIFQSATAYNNSVKARLRDIQDLRSVSNLPAGTYVATSHGSLTGLLNDDHTQYLLLAGRTTGQVANGGLDAGGNLTLDSTANASKGTIYMQPGGGAVQIGTTASQSLFSLMVNGHVGPSSTNAYDLGSSSYYWRKLYATNVSSTAVDATAYVSTSKLYIAGSQFVPGNYF
ncbi:MAG: hypothetical protein PHW33_04690, partial [Candidatus Portnoybacteria bacterium]|nr:hypothetical protein [Candidatus Portnoybacteria bacterium]